MADIERSQSQEEVDRGQQELNKFAQPVKDKAQKKAKDAAKKAVKKAIDEAKKKLAEKAAETAGTTISSWLTSGILASAAAYVIPIIIIIIILAILPFSIFALLSINKSFDANDDPINSAISNRYYISTHSDLVFNTINTLKVCQATKDDITDLEDGRFLIKNDKCEIYVDFDTKPSDMRPKVSSYVYAVDGTIDYYQNDADDFDSNVAYTGETNEDGTDKADYEKYQYDTSNMLDTNDPSNYITQDGTDENGYPKYKTSDSAVSQINDAFYSKETKSAAGVSRGTSQDGTKVEKNAGKNSKMTPEDNARYVRDSLDIKVDTVNWVSDSTKIVEEKVLVDHCYLTPETSQGRAQIQGKYKDYPMENCDKHLQGYVKHSSYETKKVYKGEIVLHVDYSIKDYKKSSLENLFTPERAYSIVDKGRCVFDIDSQGNLKGTETCSEQEATRVVHNLLFTYYRNTYTLYTSNRSITGFNDLFSLDFNRTITGRGTSGKLVYPSRALNYKDLEGTYSRNSSVGTRVWNHAFELFNAGLIHGSSTDYQCTFFAQMWFYDIYGENSSGDGASGDGKEFADVVYDTFSYIDDAGQKQHYFEYADAPSAGGLVSIDYFLSSGLMGCGHILCIDEVDYENNSIIISDGNLLGEGGVHVRQKYDLDSFYEEYSGLMTFLNPTQKLLTDKGIVIEKT